MQVFFNCGPKVTNYKHPLFYLYEIIIKNMQNDNLAENRYLCRHVQQNEHVMKKFYSLFSVILLLAGTGNLPTQTITACRDSVQYGYDFWLFTPEGYPEAPDSVKRQTPLILFLHGGSLVGRNLSLAARYGTIDAIKRGQRIDAVVIQPQTFGREHGYPSTWNTDRLANILDWAKEKVPYDTNRVYVLGMSTGGYGTLEFTYCHPDRVAAAMALCGGSARREFAPLDEVPLWLIHGNADRVVPFSQSELVYDWVCHQGKSGERIRFDIMVGYDHSSLCRFFYIPMTYEWLFKHSLAQEGRPVDRSFTITKETLSRAYMYVDPDFKASLKIIDRPR